MMPVRSAKLAGRISSTEGAASHHKLNYASSGLAAEAVVKLLLFIYGKGGSSFVVKRAQTNISMPVLLQRYIRADYFNDVGPCP